MTALIIILLFAIYLIIGKVIVMALNKYGYIDDFTLDFLMFMLYIFLPITLFVVGIQIVSDWILNILNLKK
jgi:hypothetical protein